MPEGQSPRDKNLTKAYGAATKRLRDNHRDEFDKLYQAEALKVGETWTPKPKPVDAAKQKIEDLMQEFPELANQFVPVDGDPTPGVTEPPA